jgi:hypothetical protein
VNGRAGAQLSPIVGAALDDELAFRIEALARHLFRLEEQALAREIGQWPPPVGIDESCKEQPLEIPRGARRRERTPCD